MDTKKILITQKEAFFSGQFKAMACPCEILIETDSVSLAKKLINAAAKEAWRIEHKFSRFRDDSVVADINNAHKQALSVDEETSKLLNFSHIAWEISEGLFDISSGVFRTIWDFKSSLIPDKNAIAKVKKKVGWDKISWKAPFIQIPKGMQIDLGGVGKEYAVDRVALLLKQLSLPENPPTLVNFGGDLIALNAPKSQAQWNIGIDDPYQSGAACLATIAFKTGALATSGDARQHIEFAGQRYGHIINPVTGYPTKNAPRSVTVQDDNCIQAGLLSTLAILHGEEAENFLKSTQCRYWITW